MTQGGTGREEETAEKPAVPVRLATLPASPSTLL